MQLKTALLSFALLVCPWNFCYGQISFLGVNGERGYSAMRSSYAWDLENNLVVTPSFEFYRMSDNKDVEKTGSTYRYGLRSAYDFSDEWQGYAQVFWQPLAVGNSGVNYYAGVRWVPFARHGIIKDPFVALSLGQGRTRTRTRLNSFGAPLENMYKQIDTRLSAQAGAEIGPWELKTSWQKVLQYNNRVQPGVSFSWADIPFMTAVVQGFVRHAAAVRVSYPGRVITPYGAAVRYQYAEASRPAAAVSAGLNVRWEETTFSGGIEVFEPRREESRKTFFTLSAEVNF